MAKGRCLCGAVEISTKVEYEASVVCGCTHCQACSGSAFTLNLVFPKDTLEVTKGQDQLRTYEDTGDSGKKVLRRFCGVCGNAIWSQVADGTCYVKGPVIPGALQKQPTMSIYPQNLPAWAADIKTDK